MEGTSLVCTCQREAVYINTMQPGDGITDHVDLYQCPMGHLVQIFYPLIIDENTWRRRKPDQPPPFPIVNGSAW